MRIYTHMYVDLDNVASVWAARKWLPGAEKAEVTFVPAAWDGAGLEEGDVALDIPAGGRGWKGAVKEDGKVSSCFAELLAAYAPPEARRALTVVARFVEAQDSAGSGVLGLAPDLPRETAGRLASVSLSGVLAALRTQLGDAGALAAMASILDGMFQIGLERAQAEEEAWTAAWHGPVALVFNPSSPGVNSVLFSRGARAVVYADGHNLGVVRAPEEGRRLDAPSVRALVEGEPGWFFHPAGFLVCRGSRKAPATEPSRVDPAALAEAVASVLME